MSFSLGFAHLLSAAAAAIATAQLLKRKKPQWYFRVVVLLCDWVSLYGGNGIGVKNLNVYLFVNEYARVVEVNLFMCLFAAIFHYLFKLLNK